MAGPSPPDNPRRILLVRPSALGDVARTVPALVSLRAAFPQARIDWLVNDAFVPAIAAHPALSEAIPYPRARLARAWRSLAAARQLRAWVRDLRRRDYDLVFDLQGLLRSGVITWLTGAPRRVGFADARECGWLGCNHRAAVPPSPPMHTVDHMLALLESQGIQPLRDLRLYAPAADRAWCDGFLAQHGLAAGGFAVLAPTAKWLCKCWPIDGYIEIARRLRADGRLGRRMVVLASPAERACVQPLLNAFDDAEELTAILPVTTVGRMLALIERAGLVVCNDSAPLHMAVGFGRPIVTIFGPTDPAVVGPYGRPETVVRPPGDPGRPLPRYRHQRDDQTLIGQVSVEAVWAKVMEQMALAADERFG